MNGTKTGRTAIGALALGLLLAGSAAAAQGFRAGREGAPGRGLKAALATLDPSWGRERGLLRGANVVMPNLTPSAYRQLYEIYPGKACVNETAEACGSCLPHRIRMIGRVPGSGPGGRKRTQAPAPDLESVLA